MNEPNENLQGKTGACERGFFVKRKCEKPAIAVCAITQRHICEDCAMPHEGQWVSREAYYQKMKQQNPSYYGNSSNWHQHNDDSFYLWYYALRDNFYEQQSYEPFNDYDSRAFGAHDDLNDSLSDTWDDDSVRGGFYDS
ncbi:MAG: hypothetical protein HC880_15735 [Bacteroidia bacterium]|nr:hypothetical protein [Bacteroidia bacterium]